MSDGEADGTVYDLNEAQLHELRKGPGLILNGVPGDEANKGEESREILDMPLGRGLPLRMMMGLRVEGG